MSKQLSGDFNTISQMNIEKLVDLMHDVPQAWVKQNMIAFDRSEMMYDCEMFDWQDEDNACEPEIKNGRAMWNCHVTIDCKNTWFNAVLSIPAWLYNYYMSGKADFISWKQVECELGNTI